MPKKCSKKAPVKKATRKPAKKATPKKVTKRAVVAKKEEKTPKVVAKKREITREKKQITLASKTLPKYKKLAAKEFKGNFSQLVEASLKAYSQKA